MFYDLLKKLLYVLGPLTLLHRIRNARTLTVVMFHRVLQPSDARWAGSDPDYTLHADHFDSCLGFFARHYNIVGTEAVLAAHRNQRPLPARALMITFDDGWADNAVYAAPRLAARGLPAHLFVVAQAVNRLEPFFQERLVSAWRLGRLSPSRLAQALREQDDLTTEPALADTSDFRHLVAQVERLDPPRREALLHSLGPVLVDGLQHMLSSEQLQSMAAAGIGLGAHGLTHLPFTMVSDLDMELAGARHMLAAYTAQGIAPTTLSFPHGRFNPEILQQALGSGYELIFTSVPALNPCRTPPGPLMGRVGITTECVADTRGRFRPERLALHLFRQPHRALV